MTQHLIPVSETVYQRLRRRADHEQRTVEQIADQLLLQELDLPIIADGSIKPTVSTEDISVALEAVQRLTTLFADVEIANLDQVLDDPYGSLELKFRLKAKAC
jgi:hypothetical protein